MTARCSPADKASSAHRFVSSSSRRDLHSLKPLLAVVDFLDGVRFASRVVRPLVPFATTPLGGTLPSLLPLSSSPSLLTALSLLAAGKVVYRSSLIRDRSNAAACVLFCCHKRTPFQVFSPCLSRSCLWGRRAFPWPPIASVSCCTSAGGTQRKSATSPLVAEGARERREGKEWARECRPSRESTAVPLCCLGLLPARMCGKAARRTKGGGGKQDWEGLLGQEGGGKKCLFSCVSLCPFGSRSPGTAVSRCID